jgi:hypothetical protein
MHFCALLTGRIRSVGQIWLFRNRIGDEGARCLAALLKEVQTGSGAAVHRAVRRDVASQRPIGFVQSVEPIEELHLSHNLLTSQGAAQLLWSVDRCASNIDLTRLLAPISHSRYCQSCVLQWTRSECHAHSRRVRAC